MGRKILLTERCTMNAKGGFTLTESVVTIVVVGLIVILVQINLLGLLRKNTFKAQIQEFVSTMQAAVNAAAESDRRYEVIIDITEQTYMLREITSSYLPSEPLEEEIIAENDFGDKCLAVYALFDDLVETDEDHETAYFRAGRAGWQNGGIIVLVDEDEHPYTVVVNRINRIVRLEEGEVAILLPKTEDEVPF